MVGNKSHQVSSAQVPHSATNFHSREVRLQMVKESDVEKHNADLAMHVSSSLNNYQTQRNHN